MSVSHPILRRVMAIRARVILVLVSMLGWGGAVAPKVWAAEPAAAAAPVAPPPRFDHRHQTGLALMPGIGYRVIVPYEDDKDCGDPEDASRRVCANGVPFFLDLQLSFGITKRVDVLLDLRFGIAKPDFHGRQFAIAPGARFWLDQDVALKFYTTVQALYDSTDYFSTVAKNDFGIRNANGLMYDVIRNVGFFVQFGESIGLRRWFRIEIDVGLGVQVRYP